MVEQISIYAENKHGEARKVFKLFKEADINVLCFINSDAGEFGTMRFIVSDTKLAARLLKEKEYLFKVQEVIATELEDHPGALEELLARVEDMNINIEYMYVGYSRETNKPLIIFRCEEKDIVARNLEKNNYRIY